MSETKFTPGPWTLHERPDLAFRFGTEDGWEIVAEVGSEAARTGVAICPGSHPNAALIAAAPDLYEALADIWGEIENERAGGSTRLTWAEPDNDLFKSIRAALAKARGEPA